MIDNHDEKYTENVIDEKLEIKVSSPGLSQETLGSIYKFVEELKFYGINKGDK